MVAKDELEMLNQLRSTHDVFYAGDERNELYYLGLKKLASLGLNIPPGLSLMEMYLNWSRVVVDWIEMRQDVKSFILPGKSVSDPGLLELWDANNMDSDLSLFNRDKLVYGRAFLSVGTNEDDPEHPLIRVESPREMTMLVDARRRQARCALRQWGDDDNPHNIKYATLYTPEATVHLEMDNGIWVEVDRDDHGLGRVPIIMSLNRRRTGNWRGETEMTDIIPIVDGTARTLTNLQHAQEVAAIPRRAVAGASKGDFVDQDGKPLPVWDAYMGAVWALQNKDAKVMEFAAADLDNFHGTLNMYAQQASSVSGIPVKAFGQFTSNPAAEGAIRADESQAVKRVERQNADTGVALGWTMALAERFRSGKEISGNIIKTEWQDPGTPTFSQKADALQKLAGGAPIISREGAWDELGWSEARKAREREYFDQENEDPYLTRLALKEAQNDLSGGAGVPEGANKPVA